MYLTKEDIFCTEKGEKVRRNDLRRLFNKLQVQRKDAPQSKLRRKPLMAGGKLPKAIQCKIKNVNITITHELQSGAYSEGVYKAHIDENKKEIALKRVGNNRIAQNAYQTEKRMLESLKHPNIIKMLGFEDNNRQCFLSSSLLVLKYANKGDLFDLDRTDTADMRWKYAKQIVAAIAHAHSNGIAHGDIKLENILRHNDTIWVTDWGSATHEETSSTTRGTIGYTSVNMILKVYSHNALDKNLLYNLDRWKSEKETNMHHSYSPKKEDVFALACTLFALLVCRNFVLHPETESFWGKVDMIRSGKPLDFIQVFQKACPEFVFTIDRDKRKRIRDCLKRSLLEDETKRLDIHGVNSILFDVPRPDKSNASRKRKKEEEKSDGGFKRPNNVGLRIRAPTNNNM